MLIFTATLGQRVPSVGSRPGAAGGCMAGGEGHKGA